MAVVRTGVSEESIASIVRVRNAVPSSPVLVLMMKAIRSPKCRFLQEPHGVTSQKTAFLTKIRVRTCGKDIQDSPSVEKKRQKRCMASHGNSQFRAKISIQSMSSAH
jgi:hypothetical protein